jgi:hypothetical protein
MSCRNYDLPTYRVPYGSIPTIIDVFMDSVEPRLELDTDALGIRNPEGYYNSCFQAAKRSGVCRVYKQGHKIIFVRNPATSTA